MNCLFSFRCRTARKSWMKFTAREGGGGEVERKGEGEVEREGEGEVEREGGI